MLMLFSAEELLLPENFLKAFEVQQSIFMENSQNSLHRISISSTAAAAAAELELEWKQSVVSYFWLILFNQHTH